MKIFLIILLTNLKLIYKNNYWNYEQPIPTENNINNDYNNETNKNLNNLYKNMKWVNETKKLLNNEDNKDLVNNNQNYQPKFKNEFYNPNFQSYQPNYNENNKNYNYFNNQEHLNLNHKSYKINPIKSQIFPNIKINNNLIYSDDNLNKKHKNYDKQKYEEDKNSDEDNFKKEKKIKNNFFYKPKYHEHIITTKHTFINKSNKVIPTNYLNENIDSNMLLDHPESLLKMNHLSSGYPIDFSFLGINDLNFENNFKFKMYSSCNDPKKDAVKLANLILDRQNKILHNIIMTFLRKENMIWTFTQNKLEDSITMHLKDLLNSFSNINNDDVTYQHDSVIKNNKFKPENNQDDDNNQEDDNNYNNENEDIHKSEDFSDHHNHSHFENELKNLVENDKDNYNKHNKQENIDDTDDN